MDSRSIEPSRLHDAFRALREGLARNRLKLRDRFTDAYVLSIIPDSTIEEA